MISSNEKKSKKNLSTVIALFLVLFGVFYLRSSSVSINSNKEKDISTFSNNSENSLFRRILATINLSIATIGNYAISDYSKVNSACSGIDVRKNYSETQLKSKQDSVDKYFRAGRSKLKTYFKTSKMSDLIAYGVQNIPVYIIPLISIVFS